MSKTRLDLQNILESILGSRNVYYQQPPNIGMSYPCIVYEKNNYFVNYADNLRYKQKTHYTIMLIGKKASNEDLVQSILALEYCSYNRQYKADNLYHDVFDLFF